MSSPINSRENDIDNAVFEVLDGLSIAAASRDFDVPRTTLRRRLQGGTTNRDSKENSQRLSQRQEQELINWILAEEAAGRPPSKRNVQAFAQLIAVLGSDDRPIGHNWVNRFIARHEEIKTKVSRGVPSVRTLHSTEEAFRDFYERLDREIKTKSVGSNRIYNIDETGIAEGETQAGKVVGSSLTKHSTKTTGSSREWASILECVSATGRRLTPVVVLTGTNLQGQWFPENFPSWKYDCNPSGWSNGEIALKWLEEVFLPETKPEIPSLWRILVLDGASSHVTIDFMHTAWKHHVQLLFLPAHSSHITQPLDVGVFSPLNTFYRQQFAGLVDFSINAPRQKQRFLRAYAAGSEEAFSKTNIQAGFRAAGIFPTNVERPLATLTRSDQSEGPNEAPRMPKKQKINKNKEWWTPKDSKEVRAQTDLLRRDLDGIDRGFRTVATKAGHALDQKNHLITSLKTQNTYLQAQLEAQKPTGRKAVKKNPNDTFAAVPDIVKARNQAAGAAEEHTERHGSTIEEDAMESARTDQEDMMFTFQV
ncbi:hypothetical protein HIM_10040 [Hirsutella minnesotensis 3608]|uniref:HTH CENPB-type domain-containing protein n=1 Tax=Hirsutella minnesotensis 3608 TaxID=1043627 RepID=A0A0F7ZXE3_9HYPO|nr:hypothetical protein HIM_10040 [Hirsutella minnesotensis 3608]